MEYGAANIKELQKQIAGKKESMKLDRLMSQGKRTC